MTARLHGLLVVALMMAPATRLRADEPAGTRILGDVALHEALADRTFYGRYEGGINWIEYYSPDGRSAYWDGCTHDGTWWIAHDQVCFRYRGDPSGADYCWKLYQVGSQYEFTMSADQASDGARAYTTDIRPGNRERLPLDTDDCVSVKREP